MERKDEIKLIRIYYTAISVQAQMKRVEKSIGEILGMKKHEIKKTIY
jgi:hypothetical protein